MIYVLIFIAALGWQAYCQHKGYTFFEMLTCVALGIVGTVAGGMCGAHYGPVAILVGIVAGFLVGYVSSMAFWIVAGLPYYAWQWWQRRRGR